MSQITTKNENWYRIASLFFDAILPALKSILHNDNGDKSFNGLPRDPAKLYSELSQKHKQVIDDLVKKKVIITKEYKQLFPPNQSTTYSDTFDITLTICLIQSLLNLPCKSKGWKINLLNPNDTSLSAYVIRAREIRNFICHNNPDSVDHKVFNDMWSEGEKIIIGLHYNKCNLQELKVAPLEGKTAQLLKLSADEACKIAKAADTKSDLACQTANTANTKSALACQTADTANTKSNQAFLEAKEAKSSANQAVSIAQEANEKEDATLKRLDEISEQVDNLRNERTTPEESKSKSKSSLEDTCDIIQWQVDDVFCFAIKHYENTEELVKGELSSRETGDWQRCDVKEDESDFYPPVQVIKFKELKKNVSYKVTFRSKTKGQKETKEFKLPQRVAHNFIHNGLQILVHNDGGFPKIVCPDDILKRDTQPIEVSVGAGRVKEISSYDDWLKFCQNNLYNYYNDYDKTCKTLEDWDNLVMTNWKRCFSLTDQVTVVNCERKESWKQKFITVLKEYFKRGVFVFDNYDLLRHFSFLGYQDDDLKKELDFAAKKADDLIFVFIPRQHIMLMIRIISSLEKENSLFNLQQELQFLSSDVKVFTILHSEILCGITLIPLLALPNTTELEFNKMNENFVSFPRCEDCKNYILFKDQLFSISIVNDFKLWWETITKDVQPCDERTMEKQDMHTRLLAHIIGFMATCDIPCIPGVYDDNAKCVRKISLTKIQNELLSIPDKHLIIRGGYGSGKSIICQLKLYSLIDLLGNGEKIFFLCHDKKSLLLHCMKEIEKKLSEKMQKEDKDVKIIVKDFNELAEYFNLKSINLIQFLNIISQERGNHVILDEYDGVDLSKENALKVKSILQHTNLKTSHIWISVKPLSKERRKLLTRDEDILLNEGYKFEDTEIKTKSLDKSFRNTIKINFLLDEAKETIERLKSRFNYHERNMNIREQKTTDRHDRDVNSTHVLEKDYISKVPPKLDESDIDDVQLVEEKPTTIESVSAVISSMRNTNEPLEVKVEVEVLPEMKPVEPVEDEMSMQKETFDELDHFLKNNNSNDDVAENSVVETTFHVYGSTETGHKIGGEKPWLISPFDTNCVCDCDCDCDCGCDHIIRIYIALFEIIRIGTNKTVAIICTNPYEASICNEALRFGKNQNELVDFTYYMPTLFGHSAQGNSLKCNSKNIILTDIDGVTGLEFDTVVVTLTPSEHFLSHAVVRSLTRCQSKLYLLLFPNESSSFEIPITEEIIKMWKEKMLIRYTEFLIKEKCSCEDINEPYVLNEEPPDDDHSTRMLCLHTPIRTELDKWKKTNNDKDTDQDGLQDKNRFLNAGKDWISNLPTSGEVFDVLESRNYIFQLLNGKIALECGDKYPQLLCFVPETNEVWIVLEDSKGINVSIVDLNTLEKTKTLDMTNEDKIVVHMFLVELENTSLVALVLRGIEDIIVTFEVRTKKKFHHEYFHEQNISAVYSTTSFVFIGFRDGNFARVLKSDIGSKNKKLFPNLLITPTSVGRTVVSIVANSTNLMTACDKSIWKFSTDFSPTSMGCVTEIPEKVPIQEMVLSTCEKMMFISFIGSSQIMCYCMESTESFKKLDSYDIRISPDSDMNDTRVTCMCTALDVLWVGTGSGHILIFEVKAGNDIFTRLCSIKPYDLETRILCLTKFEEDYMMLSYGMLLNKELSEPSLNPVSVPFTDKDVSGVTKVVLKWKVLSATSMKDIVTQEKKPVGK